MDWAKAWPGSGDAGCSGDAGTDAGFWTSGAAEEEAAVPGTVSGGSSEAQEDSTPSAYDNLDRVSLHQRMEDITGGFEINHPEGHIGACEEEAEREEAGQTRDSSSSWSSCEVLPLDEIGDGRVSPDMTPKKSKRSPSIQVAEQEDSYVERHEVNNNNCDDEDDDDGIHHPNSPASGSVLSDSPLSTGSSEVFLPSGPPDMQVPEAQPQPSEDHSLLAELHKQMAQQKAEYQARIQR